MTAQMYPEYELIAEIGRGTVAETYIARSPSRGEVVLKVLARELSQEPQLVDRFLLAAERASWLVHQGLSRVDSFGTNAHGIPFVAFARAPGVDLGALMQEHRLPERLAVDVGLRLLLALQACHRQGILHHDVKPRNVIIKLDAAATRIESQVLTDVGLTEALCEDEACAQGIGWRGDSLRYMAPERVAGLPVDERSDLYSVAALLYELLTGALLINEADEWSTLHAVRNGRWRRLAELAPALPPALITAIEEALSHDADYRPRNAASFAQRLTPFATPDAACAADESAERFAPSYGPVDKLPNFPRDSACSGDLLLAPTFPRSPPAPRLAALNEDAHAQMPHAEPRLALPGNRPRVVAWFVGASFSLALILTVLDAWSR